MNMPSNYNETEIRNNDFERITPGGHRLVIKQVEELKSRSGLDMLCIYFDTAQDDAQPAYFSTAYLNNKKEDKVWSGRSWLVVDANATDKNGEAYGVRNLKQFVTSVEDSNAGWNIVWGEGFCNSLKGRRVGGVFGEEEYLLPDRQVRISVKLKYFRGIKDVENAKVPDLKKLAGSLAPAEGPAGQDGFLQIPQDALEDEGLPFM